MANQLNYPTTPHPQIISDGTQYVLTGVTASPVPLWDIQTRHQAAHANIARALQGDPATTPIFLGIEHLPVLQQQWPTSRPAIVIEKCGLHYRAYCTQHGLDPAMSPHIPVCVGEWGLCSPLAFSIFRAPLYQQEITQLALELLRLPHACLHRVTVFGLPEHAWEEQFLHYLYYAIHMVSAAARYHSAHAADYAQYGRHPPTDTVGLLLRYAWEEATFDDRCGTTLPPREQRRIFSFWEKDPAEYQALFGGAPIGLDKRDPAQAETAIAPFFRTADQLLQFLQQYRPRSVCVRNLGLICNLEDFLLCAEMLKRLQVSLDLYFIDVYAHMSHLYDGGWGFHLYCDYYGRPRTTVYSIDSNINPLMQPDEVTSYRYDFRYTNPRAALVPPVASPDALEHEIAIIHSSRDWAADIQEINELYEMAAAHSTDRGETVVCRLLAHLHYWLRDAATCMPSYHWKVMGTTLNWFLHAQNRIRWVVRVVNHLRDYDVKVFGAGWERFVPASMVGGSLTYAQAAHKRRHSGVVVSCSPSYTYEVPHVDVIETLAAGGMPLAVVPMLETRAEQLPLYPFLHAGTFPYFRTVDELGVLVRQFRADWQARQAFIEEAQATWLGTLHRGEYDRETAERRCTPLRAERLRDSITGNPAHDHFVLHATVGYLYSMSGYVQTALQVWKDLLGSTGMSYLPLILRAAKSAAEIQDWHTARYFTDMGRAQHGDHKALAQLHAAMPR